MDKFEPIAPNSPFTYFNDPSQPIRTLRPPSDACPKDVPPPATSHVSASRAPEVEEVEIIDGLSDSESEGGGGEARDPILNESDYDWDINPKLRLDLKIKMLELLCKRKSAFSGPEGRLGRVKGIKMKIEADYRKIKSQSAYRVSPRNRRVIREHIEELKRRAIIQPSSSPIASPVVVVWQNGKARFCVDLHQVNEHTEIDRYGIPRQDNIFAALRGAMFVTLLDANKGYH